jgi:hypothetical protein
MTVMPGIIRTGRGIKGGRQWNFPFCFSGLSCPTVVSGNLLKKVKDVCPIKNVGHDRWSPSSPTPFSASPPVVSGDPFRLRFTSPEDGFPKNHVGHDQGTEEDSGWQMLGMAKRAPWFVTTLCRTGFHHEGLTDEITHCTLGQS